ncbi:MAG: hypothetical protein ACRDUY_03945 [Nitriliruptorales bacterium]
MSRRASLPGAEELFRTNPDASVTPIRGGSRRGGDETPDLANGEASGRSGHDTKITVYLTSQELLELEQARLRLRAEFGISVDRGRIVRQGIADLLTDLRESGADASIVRKLS